MQSVDNKRIFSTVEFDSWAQRKRLRHEEKFLIETFLDKQGRTLEAGTGGGKILFEMKALGFTSLCGFDYVGELIEQARKKDHTNSIRFEVQDAVSLSYEEGSFDQIVYLQQILCVIEEPESRLKALREAYRILKPGGIALFSFLCFDVRGKGPMYQPYLLYLRLLRKLRRSNRPIQCLPWLKLGGKLNLSALLDSPPHNYWYRLRELDTLFSGVGFQTVAVGSSYQIRQRAMQNSFKELEAEAIQGMLYVVAKKRDSY
jgi:SAM-dependent methyltransferase